MACKCNDSKACAGPKSQPPLEGFPGTYVMAGLVQVGLGHNAATLHEIRPVPSLRQKPI